MAKIVKSITIDEEVYKEIELLCVILNRNFSNFVESLLKEEILNKYIDLIDKGYCCDCNELNCIDNFPHAKITHAIRELQQQNQKYKEVINKLIEYLQEKYDSSDLCGIVLNFTEFEDIKDLLKEVE